VTVPIDITECNNSKITTISSKFTPTAFINLLIRDTIDYDMRKVAKKRQFAKFYLFISLKYQSGTRNHTRELFSDG